MDRVAAAVALATLEASQREVAVRRRMAAAIRAEVERRNPGGVRLVEAVETAGRPTYLRVPALTAGGARNLEDRLSAARRGHPVLVPSAAARP